VREVRAPNHNGHAITDAPSTCHNTSLADESAETHTASSRKNALQSKAEKAQAVPQSKNSSSTNSYREA
jgi:hypothetical protein